MLSVVFKGQKVTFFTKYHLLTLLKNAYVFPFHSKYFIYVVMNSNSNFISSAMELHNLLIFKIYFFEF